MQDQLDLFIDQFYSKYNPSDIPQGDRRVRLKQKLSQDFDGYVVQMYTKYAPDQIPDSTRLERLRSKYLTAALTSGEMPVEVQDELRRSTLGALNPMLSVPGVADAALSLGEGAVAGYDALKGLTGLTSGGLAPKLISEAEKAVFGGTSQDLAKNIDQLKSASLQQAESNVEQAQGFGNTVGAYLDNPEAIISGTLETLPLMFGGGGVARLGLGIATKLGGKYALAAASKLGQAVAAGFGEGLVTAGSSAEGIRTQTDDKLLSAEQSGLAALSGVLTGAFGVLGGRIAQKLDIADIDTFLLKDLKSGKKPDLSFSQAAYQKVVNIIKGAISEGTFEELPQSLQEQALQNKALGRDWREGLAEAAASGWFLGTAMGGGVNVLTPLRQDTDDIETPPNTAEVIKEAENLAVNTSTGDPALDKSLDEIVTEGENIVLEEAAKLEKIEGGKLEEELSLTKQKLQEAEEDREKEKFHKEMLELVREFDATATVPRNQDPISQSLANQEMEAELADVETTIDPKTGKLVMVPKPKVEPVVEQKQIKTKEEKIAAYEALKKEYDNRLYILTENQSEEEAKATDPKLKSLSDAIDQLGLPKIYGKDLKKGSQDVVGAVRKKLGLTPAAKRIAKAKAEKVVKAPKLVEPKPVKAPKVDLEKVAQKEAEEKENLRVKLVNSIDTALARKPSAALSRLDQLVQKAEDAGLPEVAAQIEKERTKLADKIADNAKLRAESKEINAKKKAKKLTKDEFVAKREKNNIEKAEKRAALPKNKKVKLGDKEMSLEKAKDILITNIAKAVRKEKGQVAVQKEIDTYKQFRKDNGLKETTDERILKQVESYKVKAGKAIETEGRKKTLEQNKIKKQVKESVEDAAEAEKLGMAVEDYLPIKEDLKGAKREGISLKEYQDRQTQKEAEAKVAKQKFDEKAALDDFKRTMEGEFGLDEGSIEDVNYTSIGGKTANMVIDFLEDHNISKLPRKEISEQQYIDLAPRSQHPILRALTKVVNRYKGKSESATKFYTIEVPSESINKVKIGGFHMALNNSDNAYIVILVDPKGRPISERQGRNVVLHEFLHDYTKLMFTRLYSTDMGFRKKMDRTFFTIQNEVIKQTDKLFERIANGVKYENLTEQERALHNAIFKYIPEQFATSSETLYSNDGLYAFTNVDEFLSELFSDPSTVAFLSQVQMDERIKTGIHKGERKSLLYKWFEDFFDYVKEKFNLTPVQNNALDYALDSIVTYDVEFSEGELNRQEGNLTYQLLSFDKGKNKEEEAPTKAEVKKALNSPIVKKLTETIWKRPEIKTFNDTLEYIKRVNQRLPEKAKLGDVYAQAIFAQVQKRRKHLEIRTKHKQLLDSYVAKNEKSPKFTKKRMQDLKDFAAVNINDLKYNEIDTYINGYTDLAYNAILDKKAYTLMIKYGKTANLLKDALAIAPQLKKSGLGGVLKGIKNTTNPATFSTIVAKFNSAVGDKLLSTFYGGIMSATARSTSESHDLFTTLSTMAEKGDLRHNNLAKVGMYGAIFSTKANPADQIAWEAEVLENAGLVYQSADNKLSAKLRDTYRGKLTLDEIKDELRIAEELLKNIKKNKSMDGILSKEEQKIYNAIREFATLHQEDFARNTKGMWDSDAPLLYNYFPKQAQGKVDGNPDAKNAYRDDVLIRGNAENLLDAIVDDENTTDSSYAKIYARKVGSNYARLNPKNYYYESDALAIAKKWSKSLLYDIYASAELKAMNRLMQNKALEEELGHELHGALMYQLQSIISVGTYADMETSSALGRMFMKGKDNLYMATLATTGQVILQASSGFVAAAVISASFNPKKGWKNFTKALHMAGKATIAKDSPLAKFLKETGLGIQLRDIGFENYLSPDDYRKFVGKSKIRKASEDLTEWGIRSGDKFAARAVWFAAFFDAGGTIENPTKEAVIHAERQVGLMQNMSDINFSAPMFKPNGQVARKILMGMFFAYKSFALNAWMSMVKAAPRVISSSEARKVMASQLGSLLAYHTLSIWAVKWAYAGIAEALTEGGDDDDEEEQKNYTKSQEIKASVLWDAAIGMWAPPLVDQSARFLFNKTVAPSIYANDMGEFEQFVDSPIFGPSKYNDVYKSMVGPGFRGYADTVEDLMNALVLEKADQDNMDVFENEEKKEAAWENLMWTLASTTAGMWSIVPLRGDLMRILRQQKQIKKRRARNAQVGGSGTINDSEIESDFEFPDYDQNAEEQSFEEFILEDN